MDANPEDDTIWDTDEELKKRHPTVTDNLDDVEDYPMDFMDLYELESLEDCCHKSMNEYARKESERQKWIKWLMKEEVKIREWHNKKLAELRAEFNMNLEPIQDRKE